MPESIQGTVMQRVFIGRHIAPVIEIATVPYNTFAGDRTPLDRFLSELLAIPQESILDAEKYRRIAQSVRAAANDVADYSNEGSFFYPLVRESVKEDSRLTFLHDFVSLIASPAGPLVSPFHLVGFDVFDEAFSGALNLSAEAVYVGLACLSGRLQTRHETESFYKELLGYDIPLSQSPEAKNDSLLNLLETSKKVCIAPLVVGGSQAISHLSHGNYIGAILTTGTASVMTLMLIGTITVGSFLVHWIGQHRSVRKPKTIKLKAEQRKPLGD